MELHRSSGGSWELVPAGRRALDVVPAGGGGGGAGAVLQLLPLASLLAGCWQQEPRLEGYLKGKPLGRGGVACPACGAPLGLARWRCGRPRLPPPPPRAEAANLTPARGSMPAGLQEAIDNHAAALEAQEQGQQERAEPAGGPAAAGELGARPDPAPPSDATARLCVVTGTPAAPVPVGSAAQQGQQEQVAPSTAHVIPAAMPGAAPVAALPRSPAPAAAGQPDAAPGLEPVSRTHPLADFDVDIEAPAVAAPAHEAAAGELHARRWRFFRPGGTAQATAPLLCRPREL